MLTRVGEKRLAAVPQMEEVRQKLLEDALEFCQAFVQGRSTDPAVRRELGRAYQRTGRIRELLGKPELAEKDYHQALDMQRMLVGEFPNEPSFAHDLARSHLALGDLCHDQQGRTADAEAAYQRALEVLGPLAIAHPETRGIKNSLAAAQNNLGVVYSETGRTDQAESAFHTALEIRAELARQHPEVSEYLSALAQSYESLGDLYNSTGRRGRAEEAFKKSVALREQLSNGHPEEPDYQNSLVKSYNKLGSHYDYTGHLVQAEEPYQNALRVCQQLAKDHPAIPEYQTDLAVTYRYLGRLYYFAGRKAEADVSLEKSVVIFERLIQEHPKQARLGFLFADSCCEIGQVIRENSDLERALPWYTRSITLWQAILQKEPQHAEALIRLVGTYLCRAEAFARLGRQEEARHDWDRMIELGEGQSSPNVRAYRAMALAHRGEHARAAAEMDAIFAAGQQIVNAFYNYACAYSLASAAALSDARLSAPERQRLAEQYASHSLDLLQKARTNGFFKTPGYVDYLSKDTDFDPLRSRDDFKKLIRQLKDDARKATGERK
jgi:tetratricopeptide (TPR) repeat protein